MKLLDKLNNSKEKTKRLKAQYKEVIDNIKKDIKSTYCDFLDPFRHSICLYYGEFVEKYSMRYLPNSLKLKKSNSWDKEFKHQVFDNYYDIYKYWGTIIDETSENVGFACELKYIKTALHYQMKNLWLYNIKENSSEIGLEEFKTSIKPEDLFKLFKQYHSRNKNIVELMHYPSLKINNIVLFIKDVY